MDYNKMIARIRADMRHYARLAETQHDAREYVEQYRAAHRALNAAQIARRHTTHAA
ncbi:hypothetical protein QNA24_29760 [Rhodococcus qingshengii]|uniref:hypothetical protein n=1 Tax=Rhodococcus TaxID=1827 RepID=UPI001E2FC412|nr:MULTISPECIES: hypothetical protein [Rhodococcus]MCD2099559.1 hypothetical protein [Rhodococcus rhodochrous]MCD2123927.1 hypothetical protein [Rhodococcus rhodochrous]MCQ4136644.1 hypothetical protein [Rhodococcus rhodochrous]MDJ0490570.1 hypothetical protein [Rhodococcus qingshengii]